MSSCAGATGQSVLVPGTAAAELAALERELAVEEQARSAVHAAQLTRVLAFAAASERGGFGAGTAAHLALALSCSEWRAHDLLAQATLLDALPGAADVLGAGELTVEQWAAVARQLAPLAPPDAALVWERLLSRLSAERARGLAHAPARLAELVRRLVAELLPAELAEQRRRNGAGRDGDDVTYDRNDDGSANLHLLGMSATNAQAALSTIAERAQPWGVWDERSPGRRRLDAATDLLTGRQALPCSSRDAGPRADGPPETVPATTCGCPAGSSAPCGADVRVLVPLATALGLADAPAELVGHGPLDAEALAALLARGPQLSAVLVDEHGVPVAVGEDAVHVPRDDPAALRAALVEVAASAAGERFPAHPLDHPPPERPVPSPATERGRGRSHRDDETVLAAAALDCDPDAVPHSGGPGPYRIRPRLRRLLQLRTLRCEWPGCGARASRCDLDHDRPWPEGSTCACNLGALCRYHHRVKQLGWRKDRLPGGVLHWTSPTGTTFTAGPQLPPVPAVVRALPPLPVADDELSPLQQEDELRSATPWDHGWDDVRVWVPPDAEQDPLGDRDRVRDALEAGDTRWTLDLQDPYRWSDGPVFRES